MLNRTNVKTRPQHSRRERRAKGLQVESCGAQVCPGCDGLAVIQHVLFAVAGRRWKDEQATGSFRVGGEQAHQLLGDWHLSFFPAFRRESKLSLRRHSNCPKIEIKVAPEQMHHFLLPEASHQECREERE